MSTDDQLGKVYDRMREVEASVSNVDRGLTAHVAECGQLREMQARSLARMESKIDGHGEQLAQIRTNLATLAAKEDGKLNERRQSRSKWSDRMKMGGFVVALVGLATTVVGTIVTALLAILQAVI